MNTIGRNVLATILTATAVVAASRETAPEAFGVGVFSLLAGSAAGFDLGATLHTVHGRTDRVDGRVEIRASSEGELSFVNSRIEVPTAGLATGNDRRDRKMRLESLAADRFPALLFVPERLALAAGDRDSADDPVDATVSGDLTIRGVTHSISVPVTITPAPASASLTVEGSFEVSLADFGIPDPSVFLLRVDKTARAWVRLELALPDVPGGP